MSNSAIRKQAAWWEALSAMVAVLLIIYLIRDRFAATAGILPSMNLGQQLSIFFLSMLSPIFWVSLIAPVSYAHASIAATSVFRAIGKGDEFGETLIKGLNKMGSSLLWGACGEILITPTLLAWIAGKAHIKLGGLIDSYVILIVGGALYFIADIGKKMRNELESFV